jgi:hypothetical protein
MLACVRGGIGSRRLSVPRGRGTNNNATRQMERECANCGYDCTGTIGETCPECGRAAIIPRARALRERAVARFRPVRAALLGFVTATPPAVCIVGLLQSHDLLILFDLLIALAIVSPGILLIIATLVAHVPRPPLTRGQDIFQGVVAICSWVWIVLALIGNIWWLLHVFT